MTSNVQVVINGKRKAKKHVRPLPNPAKNIDQSDSGKDVSTKPSKPTPEPKPKEPKPPKTKDKTSEPNKKKGGVTNGSKW